MRSFCLLSALVLGISASAKSDGPIQCVEALVASTISQTGTFAIGAYVEDHDGSHRLLSGSYLTGAHERLLLEANRRKLIKSVLWMGEMRFDVINKKPVVYAVNHTSKTYFLWHEPGWRFYDHVVPVSSDGNVLPLNLRGASFESIAFDPHDQHLAPEFEHKSTNIRHDVINSFSVLNSTLRCMHTFWNRDIGCTRIEQYLPFLPEHISNVTLALTYLLTKKTISDQMVPRLLLMMEALKQMPIAKDAIVQLDLAALKKEVDTVLELHYNEYDTDMMEAVSQSPTFAPGAMQSVH